MEFAKKIKTFPTSTGVYLMKNQAGEVLYVGKAKNLRERLSSYSAARDERPQVAFLLRKMADIDYVLTDSEKEALLLEGTLIKKYQPRYNVFLKDDKSYLSLKINKRHNAPGIFATRRIVKDGSAYFGPYASATAVRQTVDLITRHFKIRTCNDAEFANRSRPCIRFEIGRCTAPCVGLVDEATYKHQAEAAEMFLKGETQELVSLLKSRMAEASAVLKYEEAARCRDLIASIQETVEKQKVVHHLGQDYDAIGIASATSSHGSGAHLFCVLMIRQGNLIDKQIFLFSHPCEEMGEMMEHFLLQYYGVILSIPPMVLIPSYAEVSLSVGVILGERRGRVFALLVPQKGEKAKMVALATKNAAEHLQWKRISDDEEIGGRLAQKLGLSQSPQIIECVDISNIQGKFAVGAIVSFKDGEPHKDGYRRFKIRLSDGPNDYAMMYEVLWRRFRRALESRGEAERVKWATPDLVLVDGGKGQLEVARMALADLGMHGVCLAAIAKPQNRGEVEKIYLPGRKNPLPFRPSQPELLYLIRIRDEAHRFALAYHHKKYQVTNF